MASNRHISWLIKVGFVEGNESFKMVVVALKNSTGVGRNRRWKMGGRGGLHGELSPFFFFSFFFFLISDWSYFLLIDWSLVLLADWFL